VKGKLDRLLDMHVSPKEGKALCFAKRDSSSEDRKRNRRLGGGRGISCRGERERGGKRYEGGKPSRNTNSR